MTDTDGGKSMDDVLASIRRIVRAEREATDNDPENNADAQVDPGTPIDAIPDATIPDAGAAFVEDAAVVSPEPERESGDVPLALTPEMMSEEDLANADDAVEDAVVATDPPTDPVVADAGLASVVRTLESAADDTPSSTEPAAAIDTDQIRDIVREVVREELAEGRGGDMVREIIKAELTTGEIGGNISRNVLRLIRSEIAKANG